MNRQLLSKVAVWFVVAMVLFTVFKQFETGATGPGSTVAYSEFISDVQNRRITSATFQ